ncbi:hypothetical protein WA026_023140 [Henosepilachna vigintioctopunctata]|uniref:Uncharacterized protein n=1 Tax=Henosepilachna vigintioctopunctata TaxID=420089 RepID=A0AAW1U2G6_9CUCU
MIKKLCGHSKCIDIGHDSTIFYKLIFRADFLQIKIELMDRFYSRLCQKFIRGHIFDDIVQNLQKLEMVPHLKKSLVRGLLDSCQLSLIVATPGKRNKEIWDSVTLNGNENLTISRSVIETKDVTTQTARCLKILLKLCDFKGLTINGCQLNENNSIIFSEDFRLERLSLARCGPYVNVIIKENICGILDHLTELDISNNFVTNASLERIRWLPLRSLRMVNCTSHDLDIGLLWEDGVLKENIQRLDISYNNET